MWSLVTLTAAIAGGVLCIKCKVPGGALIGSIIAAALLSVATGRAELSFSFSYAAKIASGAFIGTKIEKKDLRDLRQILFPALFMLLGLCLFNILAGVFLASIARVDLGTALFATAPAGIVEMTLIGADMGAESAIITAVQSCRLIIIVSISPLILRKYIKRADPGCKNPDGEEENQKGSGIKWVNLLLTVTVAAVFGIIGNLTDLPAGEITFAMAGVAALNLTTGKAHMPRTFRSVIQMMSGAVVGARISRGDLLVLTKMLLPALVIMVGYLLINMVMGTAITRRTKLSLPTAIFGTAAGGMAEMTLVACELGADTTKVAAMQFVRNVGVIAVYPYVISGVVQIASLWGL